MVRPPSDGPWNDIYGPRTNPVTGYTEIHHGLDIGDEAGTVLVFPEDGTLTHYGPVSGWSVHGNVAIIHGVSGVDHWLSHTDAPLAAVGTTAAEGTPAAVMGVTGMTTGRHVHWETRYGTDRRDPAAWLASTATTPPPQEDDMNDDDRARAQRIEDKLDRLGRVIGGTDAGPTVFDYLRPIKAGIERLATVVGGSVKAGAVVGGNVIDRLRDIAARLTR